MKKLILLSFLFVFLCSLSAFSNDKVILLMVDASGSMSQHLQGKMKMDIAKDAITSLLKEMPDDVPLGLRAYGHYFDQNRSDEENCRATELLVPVKAGTKIEIAKQVSDLSPRGHTPIAYSLSKAPQDFPAGNNEKIIILVSDGQETCGLDPAETILGLKRQGFNVVVHTIGFDVDEVTKRQLTVISQASGGVYLDAGSSEELAASLRTVTKDVMKIKLTPGTIEIDSGPDKIYIDDDDVDVESGYDKIDIDEDRIDVQSGYDQIKIRPDKIEVETGSDSITIDDDMIDIDTDNVDWAF